MSVINSDNYIDYLLRMLDDELSPAERIATEAYMRKHPEAAAEWKALQSTVLPLPASAPVYPFKASLIREEEPETAVISIGTSAPSTVWFGRSFRRMAAAAILIGLTLLISYLAGTNEKEAFVKNSPEPQTETSKQSRSDNVAVLAPVIRADKDTPFSAIAQSINTEKRVAIAFPSKHGYTRNPGLPKQQDNLHKEKKQPDIIKPELPLQPIEIQDAKMELADVQTAVKVRTGRLPRLKKLPDTYTAKNDEALALEDNSTGLFKAWNKMKNAVIIKRRHEEERSFIAISINTQNISIQQNIRLAD